VFEREKLKMRNETDGIMVTLEVSNKSTRINSYRLRVGEFLLRHFEIWGEIGGFNKIK
jgi:hypothetical protein